MVYSRQDTLTDGVFVTRLMHGFAKSAFLIALLAVSPASPVAAQGVGTLAISPTRIVFEGRTRSAEVTLINTGSVEATYRVFFTQRRMTETGTYEDVEEPRPGENFADKLIRYSPRQVVLGPGEVQTVRLLVRKPKDLAPGEYRSHLVFSGVPPDNPATSIEQDEDLAEGELRVTFFAIFAISIPVIVRHGEIEAEVGMSDLALDPAADPSVLSLRLHRTGKRSAYGDITVTYAPSGGGDVEVGLLRGLAVFTPNESRTVLMRLAPPEGVTIEGGRLLVVYRERPDEGGAVLAEAELTLP